MELGIFKSLAGVDNWAEIRGERQRELQLAALQGAMNEQRLQQKQAAAQQLAGVMGEISNLQVLDPDISRLRTVNQELTEPIKQGLKKANGDVYGWLQSGGLIEANKYLNALKSHPTVKRALMNAYNYNQYLKDTEAGLTPRGTPQEDFAAYSSGQSPAFDYLGGYKRPAYDAATHFNQFYGKDRYTKEAVSPLALHRYIMEAAKKEGLSDQDSLDFANKEVTMYQKYVAEGANPYYYKSDDALAKQLALAKIAKLREGSGKTPGADWLLAFKATHPFNPQTAILTPDESSPFSEKEGYGMFKYNMGFDLAKGLSNVIGYEIDNKGELVNKQSLIRNNDMQIGNEKLDLSGLNPENIKSVQPTGRAVKVYDKNGNLTDGIEYSITLNEPGVDQAKYKGKNIGGFWSDQDVPFAKRDETKWNPLSGDDYSLTFTTVVPVNGTPQQFEEYRRIMSRNSPSAIGGTNFSFSAADELQNAILQEGDNILNGQ